MSLCPVCGKILCDHTPEERGQTEDEMMRQLTPEEEEVWLAEHGSTKKLIELAKRNAHLIIV